MKIFRFLALLALCAGTLAACQQAASTHRASTSYAAFATAENDPLDFGPDWRMGLADSVRAGSALFFRFTLPAGTREVQEVNVIDRFASQYGIDRELVLVQGRERTIGIVAFAPEETRALPAGLYEFAVQVRLGDGSSLLSALVPLRLLPHTVPLAEHTLAEERRRFAALLQLRGDNPSYDAVAPIVVETPEATVLARLLHFYNANVRRPTTGAGEREAVQTLSTLSRSEELSVRERELSILALEELYARYDGMVSSDR